jgi:hypothetical protein
MVESNINIYGGLFAKIFTHHTAVLPFKNIIKKLQFFNYILQDGIYVFNENTALLEYCLEIDADAYLRILSFLNS